MSTLEDFDRFPLLFGPSPVHRLQRLTEHLGGADVWAKREDCNSGIAYGGNKTRKLEYLVADALAQGCDTLVSIGGVQSNHTRQVAALAARLGLKALLVQEKWVDWPDSVNDKVGTSTSVRPMRVTGSPLLRHSSTNSSSCSGVTDTKARPADSENSATNGSRSAGSVIVAPTPWASALSSARVTYTS